LYTVPSEYELFKNLLELDLGEKPLPNCSFERTHDGAA
jgi:hypothetical protein